VPVSADPHDRRAMDAVLLNGQAKVGVEAVTRLVDAQAQTRPIMLKQEASGIPVLVLVLADSRLNRMAVVAGASTLAPAFPCSARSALGALRRGVAPAANAIVLV
jgi:hypothetical protein